MPDSLAGLQAVHRQALANRSPECPAVRPNVGAADPGTHPGLLASELLLMLFLLAGRASPHLCL